MGFLVMDEMFDSWTVAKNPYDYHRYFNEWSRIDTRDIVRRDRNHPSIVVYSAGNEIRDTPKAELAKTICEDSSMSSMKMIRHARCRRDSFVQTSVVITTMGLQTFWMSLVRTIVKTNPGRAPAETHAQDSWHREHS